MHTGIFLEELRRKYREWSWAGSLKRATIKLETNKAYKAYLYRGILRRLRSINKGNAAVTLSVLGEWVA